MDITVNAEDGWSCFKDVDTAALGVTGRDGYGQPTPTVRELIEILRAIPEEFQDLPVGRYVDEGIRGLQYKIHFPREESAGMDNWTAHVGLW